jgi:hypothetical protein
MMSMTLWLVSVLVPLQIVIGDLHGLNTIEHQPAKIAAMEGCGPRRRVRRGAVRDPDETAETNRFEIAIPALASLYLRHSFDGVVAGPARMAAADRPPVAVVFFAFRVMVGVGMLLLLIVVLGGWLRARGRLFTTPWFLALCQYAAPLGFVAVIAGWVTDRGGRQPWVIYGLMRTRDAVSPTLTGGDVVSRSRSTSRSTWWCSAAACASCCGWIRRARRARCEPASEPIAGAAGAAALRCRSGGRARHDPRSRAAVGRRSSARRCSCTCCSTASTSASACCSRHAPDTQARDLMVSSVAPIWDGNETWLVLGGLALLSAFPVAFAVMMPALYFPICSCWSG